MDIKRFMFHVATGVAVMVIWSAVVQPMLEKRGIAQWASCRSSKPQPGGLSWPWPPSRPPTVFRSCGSSSTA